MSIYKYPAILTYEDDCYYVKFPDIANCFTDGDTRQEAIEMAHDVLPLMLCDYEDRNLEIPKPSDSENIKLSSNEEVVFVEVNTTLYRKKYLQSADTNISASHKIRMRTNSVVFYNAPAVKAALKPKARAAAIPKAKAKASAKRSRKCCGMVKKQLSQTDKKCFPKDLKLK